MTIQIFPKTISDTTTTTTTITTTTTPLTKNIEPDFPFVRTNGWTHPLHYFQTIGWFLFLFFSSLNIAVLVPNLSINKCLLAPVLALNIALTLLHIAFNLLATSINSIDDKVLATRTQLRPAKFDRTKHQHVIENQYCYICESMVEIKSKHCSLCNKCVANFDHHCKWLNNCVGGKNYQWFILSMLTALGKSLSILITCIVLLIKFYVPSDDSSSAKDRLIILFCYQIDNVDYVRFGWLVSVWITLTIATIAVLLLTHLCGFHIFLAVVGMSTYEFVMKQRTMNAEQSTEANDEKDIEKAKTRLKKNNDRQTSTTLSFFKQCLPRRITRRISTTTTSTRDSIKNTETNQLFTLDKVEPIKRTQLS